MSSPGVSQACLSNRETMMLFVRSFVLCVSVSPPQNVFGILCHRNVDDSRTVIGTAALHVACTLRAARVVGRTSRENGNISYMNLTSVLSWMVLEYYSMSLERRLAPAAEGTRPTHRPKPPLEKNIRNRACSCLHRRILQKMTYEENTTTRWAYF